MIRGTSVMTALPSANSPRRMIIISAQRGGRFASKAGQDLTATNPSVRKTVITVDALLQTLASKFKNTPIQSYNSTITSDVRQDG